MFAKIKLDLFFSLQIPDATVGAIKGDNVHRKWAYRLSGHIFQHLGLVKAREIHFH